MSRLTHIVDSKNYKRLTDIHFHLLLDAEYEQAFQSYLSELEEDEDRVPKNYAQLEMEYKNFYTRYFKAHQGQAETSV